MRYVVTHGEDRRLDAASRAGLRGSFIELSDGVTHYERSGPDQGEVAVLVGSLTVPLFYWDHVASTLHDRGLRTLAYSGYGRGYSDRVRGTYDEALFVRQLTELTKFLGLSGQYHIVGSSMGALVAMAYASQRVASIATLTVAGPAGLTRPSALLRWLLAGDRRVGFVAKRLGRRWLESHMGHQLRDETRAAELAAMVLDAYRYEGSMYALFNTLQNFRLFDCAELYRRVGESGVPTMLLWGSEDHVTPIDNIERARALLRPLQCHIIEECGHMAPFERPRDVADKIAAFASSTERIAS